MHTICYNDAIQWYHLLQMQIDVHLDLVFQLFQSQFCANPNDEDSVFQKLLKTCPKALEVRGHFSFATVLCEDLIQGFLDFKNNVRRGLEDRVPLIPLFPIVQVVHVSKDLFDGCLMDDDSGQRVILDFAPFSSSNSSKACELSVIKQIFSKGGSIDI